MTLAELLYSARVGTFIRCMIGDISPDTRQEWIREIDSFNHCFDNYMDDELEDISLYLRPED